MTLQPLHKKIIALVLILAVAYFTAVVTYSLVRKIRKGKASTSGGTTPGSTVTAATVPTGGSSAAAFPLRWGSDTRRASKNTVKTLQNVCNYYGAHIVADGIWGENTEKAVDSLREASVDGSQVFKPYISPLSLTPASSGSHWQVSNVSDFNTIVGRYNNDLAAGTNKNIL